MQDIAIAREAGDDLIVSVDDSDGTIGLKYDDTEDFVRSFTVDEAERLITALNKAIYAIHT